MTIRKTFKPGFVAKVALLAGELSRVEHFSSMFPMAHQTMGVLQSRVFFDIAIMGLELGAAEHMACGALG